MSQCNAEHARSLCAQLVSAGFDEANVARWYGVPLVTDARWVPAPADRPRRGLGGWIALWVAGEAIAAEALRPAPTAEERGELMALGLVADDGAILTPRARLVPWRGLVVASPPDEAFDVSALNVAASLPPARALWDVGCGAGLLALVAARAGARVHASDVDAGLVGWAALNAALNGLAISTATGDLLAAAAGGPFDVVAFNAPLQRAPLAGGDEAPRYSASPEGEALALRFLDGVRAHAIERVLLHAQLTPAIDAALDDQARAATVLSVVFAHAPDGTPHALTEIRREVPAAAAGRRRAVVPLSAACRHLSRAILDALAAPRALDDSVTPVPAPWLELRTTERYDGGRRQLATTFGGVAVDADDQALLDRLRGDPLGAIALTSTARERLCAMIERGHVIVR